MPKNYTKTKQSFTVILLDNYHQQCHENSTSRRISDKISGERNRTSADASSENDHITLEVLMREVEGDSRSNAEETTAVDDDPMFRVDEPTGSDEDLVEAESAVLKKYFPGLQERFKDDTSKYGMPSEYCRGSFWNGQFMNLHALARLTANPATQQLVWEAIFNINHVQRHRWRLGDNLNDVVNLNAIPFAFSIQSDGVKAHLLFEKPILLQIEPVVTTRAESAAYRKISTLQPGPKPGLWQQEVEVRTRSYHARTQVFWEYSIRKKQITSPSTIYKMDTINLQEIHPTFLLLSILSSTSESCRVLEIASARQSANHHIMNQLLGLTPPFRPGTKMHHIHLSSKRMRKRWHHHRRQAARELSGWVRNENDTIIFWGRVHYISLLTNQIHSDCDAQLVPIRGTYIRTPHRMKRKRAQTRIRRTRGQKVKTCVNMDGQRLHRQSLCTQGQQQRTELWSLKRCLNHEHDVVIDRDRNAARNMRRIGLNYMIMDGDQDHRPVPLRRPQLIGHQ
ncbi:hypothetical protein BJV82DRAFT_670525 [Fennellomyces sp. T-0311]|nr:hypothetical protein BJV82DRAFT_670525 [Fennellomyces sp. T-0311]